MKGRLPSWEQMHHAYILESVLHTDVWRTLEEELSFNRQGNPDALSWELETFGVDEARLLSDWAIKKPFGERKVAVISSLGVTSEAQNAMLKLFEEPTAGTYFFIVLRNSGALLPTLLSRVHVINAGEKLESKEGEKFLKNPVSKRLKQIAPIIKEKDKEKARELVAEIALFVPKEKSEPVLQAQRFLGGRAPSVKMILEHLAVTLPVL